MPRDLFGDVAVRPPSVRSRRSPVVIASIGVHVLVVIAVLVATAIAPDILPTPREALAFYEPARLIDIELPPPPPTPRQATAPPDVPTVSPSRRAGRRSHVNHARDMVSRGRAVERRRRRTGSWSGVGRQRRRRARRRRLLLLLRRLRIRCGCTAGSRRRKRSSTCRPPIRKWRESRGLRAW